MPTTDPIDILLAHDRWATHQLLCACAALTPAQFHQRFDIGPGSLHDTVAHILAAMRTWTQTLAAQPPGPRIDQDQQQRAPAQLIELLDSYAADFAAEVRRLPLAQIATRDRQGKTYHYTRSAILSHVVTHSMHHRAQCLNMLRHLGVKPLPPSSIAEWSFLIDNPS